jgi:CHAT domain-containing protein
MPDRTVTVGRSGIERRRALIALERGDIPRAERQITALIDKCRNGSDRSMKYEQYQLHQARATLYRRANRWADALEDLATTEKLVPGLPGICRKQAPATIAHARAKIYADEFYSGASTDEALRQLSIVRSDPSLGFAADDLEGQLAFRAGNWPSAIRLSKRAADELDQLGWKGASAVCRRRAVEAMIENGDLDAAEKEIRAVKSHVDKCGTPEDIGRLELTRAKLFSARGSHNEAWESVNISLKQFDLLISRFSTISDQQRFLLDKLQHYSDAFRIALAGEEEKGLCRAWGIAERSKSFYLCQLMASASISLFDGVDARDLERYQKSCDDLTEADRRLGFLNEVDKLGRKGKQLIDRIQEISARKQRQLESLMRNNPKWARVSVPSAIEIPDDLAYIPAGWTPLCFFWGAPPRHIEDDDLGNTLHIFWVDKSGKPRHTSTDWRADELRSLRLTRQSLRGRVQLNTELIPETLTDLILPRDVRETIADGTRILVSPHGLLQLIPLHGLVLESGGYAASRWAFQYLPTLSLLPLASQKTTIEDVLLLGCERDGFGSAPLYEVGPELSELSDIWGVEASMIPPDGSPAEMGVGVETWERYGVIHVACHGDFPKGRPFDASLRLGADTIRASDLFRTKVNVRVATFSACSLARTAESIGDNQVSGSEWVGLYLPLLYGGARCVVASLWEAYSEPAAIFMRHLHKALKRGDTPADAVRWAQDRTAYEVHKDWPATWANWYPVGLPS